MGFKVKIGGMADNFQFHILLAGKDGILNTKT
jgi:hypothetical protein